MTYDEVKEMLSMQVLGGVTTDQLKWANRAMELGLDKLQQMTNLISQEKQTSFTSTGAGTYTFDAAPISKNDVFRAVKFWTANNDMEVMAHQEFITRYPDYLGDRVGLPKLAVMWGEKNLIVHQDSPGDVIYFSYYAFLDANKVNRAWSALFDIARHYLEGKAETRMLNWQIAQASAQEADRANDRSVGTPVTFLPEERISIMNAWKRRNR